MKHYEPANLEIVDLESEALMSQQQQATSNDTPVPPPQQCQEKCPPKEP